MPEGAMAGGAAGAGAASAKKIAPVVKGDKGRTLMHADVANEVIASVNQCQAVITALKAAKVSPETAGQFMWGDANMVLKLNNAGGGGSGVLEEVTGAVNGVPATLNVMTDGEGWTEI